MWYLRAVFAVVQPHGEILRRPFADHAQGDGGRVAKAIEDISELGVFGCAMGIDDVPERVRLWRWGLGIEAGKVEPGEISGDVSVATGRFWSNQRAGEISPPAVAIFDRRPLTLSAGHSSRAGA